MRQSQFLTVKAADSEPFGQFGKTAGPGTYERRRTSRTFHEDQRAAEERPARGLNRGDCRDCPGEVGATQASGQGRPTRAPLLCTGRTWVVDKLAVALCRLFTNPHEDRPRRLSTLPGSPASSAAVSPAGARCRLNRTASFVAPATQRMSGPSRTGLMHATAASSTETRSVATNPADSVPAPAARRHSKQESAWGNAPERGRGGTHRSRR